jgi:hypothetical protein
LPWNEVTKEIILEKDEKIMRVWEGNYEGRITQEMSSGYGGLVLTSLRLIWMEEKPGWFGRVSHYNKFVVPRQEIVDITKIDARSFKISTRNGYYEFHISASFEDFKNTINREQNRKIEREKQLELLKNYETAGKFEEAAKICDELEMWEKAGEFRRMAKTTYLISTNFSMGKDGAISVNCPNCGSAQALESKTNMVTCIHCGNNYIIPKKVLDML